MEAGDLSTKQSSHSTSASNAHPHLNPASESPPQSQPQRPSFNQGPREHHNMATAALISPSAPYPPHLHSHGHPHSPHHHQPPPPSQHHTMSGPPSYFPPSAGYTSSAPSNSASMPGMLSPADTRRSSDDHEPPSQSHRQSLPSITEVIGPKIPGGMPPLSQTSLPPAPSLPSPFSTTTPTRPFPPDIGGERHPSPRTLQPMSTGFARPESLPAFSDPARSARAGGPPPLSNIAGPSAHESSPPLSADHLPHHHERVPEHQLGHINGSYNHPQSQPPPYTPQPGQLPPGQLPLGPYPISPRHQQPPLPSPFDAQRPPLHPDDPRAKYEHTLNRHFEAWSYAEHLAKIGSGSRTLYNFAESYQNLAREEHAAQPIPGRLPSEREVSEMISLTDHLHTLCENVRNIVQQSIIQERASREGNKARGFDDDEVMYDGMKAPYGVPDVKKRRGRAAPPGRCHSCNRIDTPEWRRGPDGARTLCNACGLHYAKLERKRQSENKRSKPSEAHVFGYPREGDRGSGVPREDDQMSGTEGRQ